jgi:hypothetical protein
MCEVGLNPSSEPARESTEIALIYVDCQPDAGSGCSLTGRQCGHGGAAFREAPMTSPSRSANGAVARLRAGEPKLLGFVMGG